MARSTSASRKQIRLARQQGRSAGKTWSVTTVAGEEAVMVRRGGGAWPSSWECAW